MAPSRGWLPYADQTLRGAKEADGLVHHTVVDAELCHVS